MRIYVIDDEPTVLMASEQIIRRALPDAEVTAFLSAAEALDALNHLSKPLDVCFCDIEMPGINGLEFALRLKQISPETKIVFVTAYSEYALEAFRIHANGYILKPINAVRVLEEIGEPATSPRENGTEFLKVQCFGSFEVFWRGKPLLFSRKKTRLSTETINWLEIRRMVTTEVPMPTGMPALRMELTCMGWPPLAPGVMLL